MQRNDIEQKPENDETEVVKEDHHDEPEHPAPGIEHYPEPDAENIMPIEDGPGTF